MAKRRQGPASRIQEDSPLLLRRMMAVGLDVSVCARFEPIVMADLQAVCHSCRSRSRCAIDLAKRSGITGGRDWKSYCPNALRLTGLVASKPTDWVAALREVPG
jgi:hypothetical protein